MVATMTINKFWDYVIIVDVKATGKVFAHKIWLTLRSWRLKGVKNCCQNKKKQQMLLKMKAYGLMKKDYWMLLSQTMIISMRMSLKLQLQQLMSKEKILVGILILEPPNM